MVSRPPFTGLQYRAVGCRAVQCGAGWSLAVHPSLPGESKRWTSGWGTARRSGTLLGGAAGGDGLGRMGGGEGTGPA